MAHCPYCDNELAAEALACTNCGAQKTYDYFNRSVKRLLIGAAASALLAAYFLYFGYTSPDPKMLSGAKVIAAFFGVNSAAQLLLLYRGRVWRKTWFMQRAHDRARATK